MGARQDEGRHLRFDLQDELVVFVDRLEVEVLGLTPKSSAARMRG
jgi:hypothetical protein